MSPNSWCAYHQPLTTQEYRKITQRFPPTTAPAADQRWMQQASRRPAPLGRGPGDGEAARLGLRCRGPAGAVQTGEDLWRDVHLRARDAIVTLEHPEPDTVEHTGLTVQLHGTPGRIQWPLGRLGEANEEVFGGLLGLAREELARLVEAGVIA